MEPPIFIDVFIQPIRDSQATQVAFAAFAILMALDVLLGFLAASKNHEVKSSKMREGLWHKTGELGVVAIGDVLDGVLLGGVPMSFSAPVTLGLLVYLIVNEAVSCYENACKLSPSLADSPLAKVLHDAAGTAGDGDLSGDEGGE